jgi:glycosyltransferase involved in cell wall biosynthesis
MDITFSEHEIYCSLIVLTYDRPSLLKDCLDSIVDLEKRNIFFEVIVVDDGSKFDNFSIVIEYGQKLNIRYHRKNHQGVAASRNFGIKLARGKLIAFIADDYRLPKNFLMDVVKFFEQHREAFVITHNILPCGPSLFRYVQRLYFQLALWQNLEHQDIKNSVLKSYRLPPSRGAVFRKEIFHRIGGLTP